VSSVHSQGNCGACWAIAAVETIESANFIKNKEFVELAESEVIICEDECNMCYGGWPQNAYEYAIKNKGLAPSYTLSYDGDFLLALTMITSGESDEYTQETVDDFKEQVCVGGAQSDASIQRYAAIKSYAYATERCICYTDGSGCECDEQDENLAIRNIASYGPATVCLEASTWQDYSSGVITKDSGCSAEFMDMNHCVQVVGYVFYDDEEDGNNGYGRRLSGSQSSDDSDREGYWIVRNQWSSYWGMNGYAYVAMGGENANTCGFVNDITQVFFD